MTVTPTFSLGPNQISTDDANTPANLKLHKRTTNNGGAWTLFDGTSANTTGVVTFNNIDSFSEFGVGTVGTSPLPITLVSFNASRINTDEVQLTWTTATEINNKGFEIEQSANGTDFQQIAFVDGRGNSSTLNNYHFSFNNPNDVYVRLKQMDLDGKFSYSPIRFVEGIANQLYFAPNPMTNTLHLIIPIKLRKKAIFATFPHSKLLKK